MAVILIADDDKDTREFLDLLLRDAGHQPVLAQDGHEAIAIARAQPLDLAIVDIFMPGRDGLETIVELRRLWPRPRILAISAGWWTSPNSGARTTGSQDVLDDARRLGADAVVGKPLNPDAFLQTVRALVGEPGARS